MSGFQPVTRLGTLKLLKLQRETLAGSAAAADEMLRYIGQLEQSETALLERILEFTRDFKHMESRN